MALRRIMLAEMGKIADNNGGIQYADFNQYVAKPETKELFSKLYEVKAELRTRGVIVPNSFPEHH